MFVGAFAYILHYKKTLAKALVIPFIVYFVSGFLEFVFYYYVPGSTNILISLFLLLSGFAAQIAFAIVTHRVVILGPESVDLWGITSWSKRETNFLIHIVLLSAVSVIFLAPFSFHPHLALIAGVVVSWYASRFFLVFPAIATDNKISFRESWELTKKCHLFIFLVIIVFPILLAIPNYLTNYLPYAYFINLLITPLILLFEIAALSLTFKMIIDLANSDSSIGENPN